MTAILVETFEVTEIDSDGQPECEAEALELIERLGLAGQQKLIAKNADGQETRCPYRKMTEDERLVYSAICPQSKSLREFSDSAIPVRVLQVAAHAIDLFQEVVVWSAKNADIKDPVLVGKNTTGHTTEYFLLARWGEVLEPFEKLYRLAVEKCRQARKAGLSSVIVECEQKRAAAEAMDDGEILRACEAPYLADFRRTLHFV